MLLEGDLQCCDEYLTSLTRGEPEDDIVLIYHMNNEQIFQADSKLQKSCTLSLSRYELVEVEPSSSCY